MTLAFSAKGFASREETARCLPWLALLAALVVLFLSAQAAAKEAVPLAVDEAVEKRLVAIASELRCLVCQNESLAGSHAELANDLRREIRTMIGQGRSDREILDFMVSRYGDFVLYRPPLKSTTVLLWFGPIVLLLGGLAALIAYLRRRDRQLTAAPLSPEEKREAERLLNMENEQR